MSPLWIIAGIVLAIAALYGARLWLKDFAEKLAEWEEQENRD